MFAVVLAQAHLARFSSLVLDMLSRVKNTATAGDVAKVLRANMVSLRDDKFASADINFVIQEHCETLVDLLKLTDRPTARLVADGARLAFNCEVTTGKMFGERMAAAISFCRTKKSQMTSGKKLQGTLLKVINALGHSGAGPSPSSSPSPAPKFDKLWGSGKKLLRRVSSASSDCQEAEPASKKPKLVAPTRAAVFALYGASSSSSGGGYEPSGVVDLCDSDGEAGGASGAAGAVEGKQKKVVREYLDKGKPCMMRCYDDGTVEESTMTPGPKGFGVSQFGTEAPTETEVPNLVLVAKPVAMKKPAASSAPKQKPAAEHLLDEAGFVVVVDIVVV
jgi:hypothetical protein